jgi:hypothetical protein
MEKEHSVSYITFVPDKCTNCSEKTVPHISEYHLTPFGFFRICFAETRPIVEFKSPSFCLKVQDGAGYQHLAQPGGLPFQ